MHVCDVCVMCVCSVTVGHMEEQLLWEGAYVVCMHWCGGSILATPRTELVRQKEAHSKAILFWARTQCPTFLIFYWFSAYY